ncbi:MAG: hypothetical protein FJ109_10200 [Deltaproteobacteria bacterium]|nr:hypothetical protein [Deltaproteobacteria bacterium]
MRRTLLLAAVVALSCTGSGSKADVVPGGDSAGPQDSPSPPDQDWSTPGQDALEGDGPMGETPVREGSGYKLTVELEKGPGVNCEEDPKAACFDGAECCTLVFDRDITNLPTKFSFGSTHIAPAISFAMTDTLYVPTFSVITLNFGIIIGTSDKPPATDASGKYPFSGFEPEITVTIYSKVLSSKEEGSEGEFDVTDWAAEQGGLWAGTVSGTIFEKTALEKKLRARVKGSYHFILPEPQGGQ